jgi:hypothetical protein
MFCFYDSRVDAKAAALRDLSARGDLQHTAMKVLNNLWAERAQSCE